MAEKFDAYTMATDKIVSLLESGIIPWARPWSSVASCAWSRSTGNSYSMLNQMLLADPDKRYHTMDELLSDVCGEWLTFKQALDLGGSVRKGEHGRKIVFFKMLERDDPHARDEDGDPLKVKIPYLQAYTVFRVSQCDGISQKYRTEGAEHVFAADLDADQLAADYIRREGITLDHVRQNRAYYAPQRDLVVMPLREQFSSPAAYYATLYHELTHSTGHESRLKRLTDKVAFGDDVYSAEELVAEIGSASLLATLGIDTADTLRNSAAYVQSWIKALKQDKKLIVVAAARAEKAVKLILGVTD